MNVSPSFIHFIKSLKPYNKLKDITQITSFHSSIFDDEFPSSQFFPQKFIYSFGVSYREKTLKNCSLKRFKLFSFLLIMFHVKLEWCVGGCGRKFVGWWRCILRLNVYVILLAKNRRVNSSFILNFFTHMFNLYHKLWYTFTEQIQHSDHLSEFSETGGLCNLHIQILYTFIFEQWKDSQFLIGGFWILFIYFHFFVSSQLYNLGSHF